jgi:peroxiredoxin
MNVKTGDEAPDFELDSHRGGKVRLSSFRGTRRVIVAFHPFAWTPN